jgi:uncharacterized RDD family membrane protein YckC
MSFGVGYLDDGFLVDGALSRRCLAWAVDLLLIGVLVTVLWMVLLLFGLLTFGLGFGALSILPFVPFLYNVLSLLSGPTATPGQQMLGLTVRRDADLGPPTALQAVILVVVFYLTLATSGLLLVVALFTTRHRTLHDIVSGLVVVRVRAMEALTTPGGGGNMRGRHDL